MCDKQILPHSVSLTRATWSTDARFTLRTARLSAYSAIRFEHLPLPLFEGVDDSDGLKPMEGCLRRGAMVQRRCPSA